jgi:hypothetical protein
MKNIQKFLILLAFVLLSACDNNKPTIVSSANNCDCYKGDSLAKVIKLPDINPLPLELYACGGEPLPIYLRFVDSNGRDLLYNLPNDVPIKLCNNKKIIFAYIIKNDKLKKAYLNAGRATPELNAYKFVKEKTFCLTIGDILKGNLYIDYQYIQEEHCIVPKRGSLRFNEIEFSDFVYDAEFNTLINTIIIK